METHRKLSMQKYLLHYAVVSCPCFSVDLKHALLIVIQDYDNLLVNFDTKQGWRPNSSLLLTRITFCQNIEYGRQWVTSLSLSGQRLSWKLAEQTWFAKCSVSLHCRYAPKQGNGSICNTGRARLIRSHSSARFYFELSGNSN